MAVKIDRDDAYALIPEETTREIIAGVRKESVAMQLMRQLPNMNSRVRTQPVLQMLPQADFVDGDAGMKMTTNVKWGDKQLVVGEIAVIVPIPEAVLDDADYDIWAEVSPLVVEKIGRVFDNQVFNGGNPKAPKEWPEGLIPMAIEAGNVIRAGTGNDIADDINNLFGKLEEQEYDVTGLAAQRRLRTQLRGLRDNNGQFIYAGPTDVLPGTIFETPTYFVGAGTWDKSEATAIAGEWDNAVYAIRQDMTFRIFDSGVISDDEGKIIFNLMQQDMVAMRVVLRIAWQVSNPIDIDRQDIEGTFPFAVLQPSNSMPETFNTFATPSTMSSKSKKTTELE